MKKVGIITFHGADNYGSVLQTYALQKTILKYENYKCEIIDFTTPKQEEMYSIFRKADSFKNLINNLLSILNYKLLKVRQEDFFKFRRKNFIMSKIKYNSYEELKKNELNYNYIICGSDQIWNIDAYDYDKSYFLGFANNGVKKIAYAPSFGGIKSELPINLKSEINNYLNDFHKISVREESGKKIIKDISNKIVETVLDPTFLLDFNEWNEVANKRIIKEDYIFFYSIDYNSDAIKIAKIISKKLDLPIVILYTINRTYKTILSGFKMAPKHSPEDFLSLIKNANLILSSSFHGSVFSIIYRKPFYVVRGTYDGKINNDDRLTTLLNKFKIYNREININNVNEIENIDINYENIEEFINNEIKKSKQFLINAIK
ncbi:polysaccharide pyruvyl transferase family protein [Clostridium perfringens]|nr:polysaccharide pyruvyl transferase family protein [Clostridium perfringens]